MGLLQMSCQCYANVAADAVEFGATLERGGRGRGAMRHVVIMFCPSEGTGLRERAEGSEWGEKRNRAKGNCQQPQN